MYHHPSANRLVPVIAVMLLTRGERAAACFGLLNRRHIYLVVIATAEICRTHVTLPLSDSVVLIWHVHLLMERLRFWFTLILSLLVSE